MNKRISRKNIISTVTVLVFMSFMMTVAVKNPTETSAASLETVRTVQVQSRSFDTITMDQYDRIVDFVYKYAGQCDFAVQYALSECILNDIESSGYRDEIDTYLDDLYIIYEDSLSQTNFEHESEDKQDAIREAVQSALDERTMPSDVTKFEKYNDSNTYFNKYENYSPEYLGNSLLKFYYSHHYIDHD